MKMGVVGQSFIGLYVACSIGDDVSGSSFETENSIAFGGGFNK